MSRLSVQIGLLFALATAVTSIVGFLLKYRGADESPAVTLSNPIRSSLALFGSRWYTIGIIVATGSWGLHVAALSLAPISIVQSVIAGGLVLLTVIADRVFGYQVTRREWIGVALTALGLALLAAAASRRITAGGPALALSAGLLWGASDVSIKALSHHLDQGALGWIHPLALVILLASLVGLSVSARSLQVGEAVS